MRKEAFLYQIGRTSINLNGKKKAYDEFIMAEYLSPNEDNVSIQEKKKLFNCRVEDVYIEANHKRK